jgi:hypothetical protein
MRSRLIGGLAWVAILTAGLVLAACGSSSDNNSSTTGISKAEFVRKATEVCLKGNARIGRAIHDILKRRARLAHTRGESAGPPTSAEIAKLGKVAIPTIQRELDQIRALGAAPGAEHKINALIDEEQSAVDKVRAAPGLFGSQSKTAPFRTSKVAADYGLSFCGLGS